MIRRLAYVSRPRPDLPAQELSRIVVASRVNNARDHLCGVLVYTGLDFAQLIEGASAHVYALWNRIKRDDRHRDLVLLFDETAPTSWFPDWRMGYLADRKLSLPIGGWRGLDCAMDERGRLQLRRLLAAADSV